MIENMKIIKIPNPLVNKTKAKDHNLSLINQNIKILQIAKSRQSSLINIKTLTHIKPQPPISKVRQLATRSIKFQQGTHLSLKSSPPNLIKTRAVLLTSFKKKQDSAYLIPKSPHPNPSTSKQALSSSPGRNGSASSWLIKTKSIKSAHSRL